MKSLLAFGMALMLASPLLGQAPSTLPSPESESQPADDSAGVGAPQTILEEGSDCEGDCPEACKQLIEALRAEFKQDIQKLRDELTAKLDAIDARVITIETVTVPDLQKQIDDLEQYVKVDEIEPRLTDVESGLETATTLLDAVRAVVRDVSTQDNQSTNPSGHTLAMRKNMNASPEVFREEVYRTTKFRLKICNPDCQRGYLRVNGVWWEVIPVKVSYVPVPPGPITVQKRHCEPLVLADEQVEWRNDDRGYYLEYEFDRHALAQRASK